MVKGGDDGDFVCESAVVVVVVGVLWLYVAFIVCCCSTDCVCIISVVVVVVCNEDVTFVSCSGGCTGETSTVIVVSVNDGTTAMFASSSCCCTIGTVKDVSLAIDGVVARFVSCCGCIAVASIVNIVVSVIDVEAITTFVSICSSVKTLAGAVTFTSCWIFVVVLFVVVADTTLNAVGAGTVNEGAGAVRNAVVTSFKGAASSFSSFVFSAATSVVAVSIVSFCFFPSSVKVCDMKSTVACGKGARLSCCCCINPIGAGAGIAVDIIIGSFSCWLGCCTTNAFRE
mmetsp:Transcript_4934/g.7211  ORF Transcript_4934/g.7211 Transcript_4934/m.7211 type:complete len:285 (-) Transcript_4934:84-938(-)